MMWSGKYGFEGFWFFPFVILLVIPFLRWGKKTGDFSDGRTSGRFTEERETAMDILKKRYARGEISREEYERMKRDIEG